MKRYDLDGLRLRLSNGPYGPEHVWLVLDGVLHLVDPHLAPRGIFLHWDQTWTIDQSPSLLLEFGDTIVSERTYLSTLGNKLMFRINNAPDRWIVNPDTFNRFGFNGDAVAIQATGGGPDIRWQPAGDGDLAILEDKIYLMDQGQFRHIVDMETYRDLFGATGAVHIDPWNGMFGPDLDRSVKLIQAPDHPEIWLLDNGRRRHISDQNAMQYYGFARGVVHSMPYGQLIEYMEGRPIAWPSAYG